MRQSSFDSYITADSQYAVPTHSPFVASATKVLLSSVRSCLLFRSRRLIISSLASEEGNGMYRRFTNRRRAASSNSCGRFVAPRVLRLRCRSVTTRRLLEKAETWRSLTYTHRRRESHPSLSCRHRPAGRETRSSSADWPRSLPSWSVVKALSVLPHSFAK